MAELATFSLWALPPAGSPPQIRLSKLIAELSADVSLPPFEPHVTVIGGIGEPQNLTEQEVVVRTEALCRKLKPYRYQVQDLSSGSSYFQCVFLRMLQSDEVMQANEQAREIFDISREQALSYMPHLSLLYGDLQEEDKEKVKDKLQKNSADLLADGSFHVSSFSLYRTDPTDKLMTTWAKVGEYALQGQGGLL